MSTIKAKEKFIKNYEKAFMKVASNTNKLNFQRAKKTDNVNNQYKLIRNTKVKDPISGTKHELSSVKGRKLTKGRLPKKIPTKKDLNLRQKKEFLEEFLPLYTQTIPHGEQHIIKNIMSKGNSRVGEVYNYVVSQKIKNSQTKRNHGVATKEGRRLLKNKVISKFKTKLSNRTSQNNYKAVELNKLFKLVGVKNAMSKLGNIKIGTYRSRNGEYVPSGRLHRTELIRAELAKLTNGEVTLGGRTKTLGAGVAGLAVTCVSNTKCNKDYKDLVLKASAANDEWKNEVKFLTKITKWMDKNRNKDPLAPRIIGSFSIGNKGFILMQNATKVFKNTVPGSVKEWERVGTQRNRFEFLPAIKKAMKQLHEIGIMHGNMHWGNVWVAKVRNKGGEIVFQGNLVNLLKSNSLTCKSLKKSIN